VSGVGADLAGALRAVDHPGLATVFTRLATVATLGDAGVPLAELLDRLDAELRAHRRAAERAVAQLAAVRATTHLLAVLPLLGLLIGYVLGVDPLDTILHTPAGGVSAVVAMVLQVAGAAWTERLTRPAAAPA
jgi:tight adherence protein B